jgi:hypothetical protein
MDTSPCSFRLSTTSQQYFSLRTKQPPATNQQSFSLRTNQHQPSGLIINPAATGRDTPPGYATQPAASLGPKINTPSLSKYWARLTFLCNFNHSSYKKIRKHDDKSSLKYIQY